jgi:hypothetical protein
MTARTRTVKKTTEPTTPTPAKKTTAKRTPAKPRTPRTRKTTTPVLSLVKEQPTVQPQPTVTLVDLRKPLKRRRRNFTGPHTPAQLTEARACLASAMAGLPIPHILWLTQINGHAAARLADGTHLIHTHHRNPEFTAILRCPTGGLHTHLVTNNRDLKAARTITGTCTRRHDDTDPGAGGYDWHKATTLGIQKLIPARLSPLNAGLKTAKKATAKTQPMNTAVIAEGLAARAAANTDPKPAKEPPQP